VIGEKFPDGMARNPSVGGGVTTSFWNTTLTTKVKEIHFDTCEQFLAPGKLQRLEPNWKFLKDWADMAVPQWLK